MITLLLQELIKIKENRIQYCKHPQNFICILLAATFHFFFHSPLLSFFQLVCYIQIAG